MLHLIWYILVGLIAGIIAKSIMHAHLTIFWTIVLGIIGSIIGGAVTHMFVPPRDQRFHPAGLIFSTLGAILFVTNSRFDFRTCRTAREHVMRKPANRFPPATSRRLRARDCLAKC